MSDLLLAAQAGHTADVAALLADGADVNVHSAAADGGCTPLYVACQNGHTEIVTARGTNRRAAASATTTRCTRPATVWS